MHPQSKARVRIPTTLPQRGGSAKKVASASTEPNRSRPDPLQPGNTLTRVATLLGATTVIAACCVTGLAYHSSKQALTTHLAHSSEVLASSVRGHGEHLLRAGAKRNEALERAWLASGGKDHGLYLCFVGHDGKLNLHTNDQKKVGRSVSEMDAYAPGEAPAHVMDLLTRKQSWSGENLTLGGVPQVVSFAYSEPFAGLVTVHVPKAVIDERAMKGMLPWFLGMGFVTLILLPSALGLMHLAYRRSERALAGAHAQRAQLAERLTESARLEAVGRLAGGIAHDFNNLLMVIVGSTEALQDEEQLSDLGQEDLEQIQAAAERGTHLVKQLLSFSAMRKGKRQIVDPGQVLLDLGEMLKRAATSSVQVDLQIESGLSHVRADRGQLEQVVTNLVINARDAMPDGGKVAVHAYELKQPGPEELELLDEGSWVCVAVTDEGHGMSPEVQARAFEPYFTTKGRDKGTGLGLATSYAIAKQHGGHLSIQSTEGVGTTINLYLPATDEPLTSTTTRTPSSATPHYALRVLVVEDEDPVRRTLVRLLEGAGCTVVQAASATMARELFHGDGRFELVVSDVVMPGDSGEVLAHDLLATDPNVRVLLVSGFASTTKTRNWHDPRVAFLSKPFTQAALDRTVNQLFSETKVAHIA